MGLNLSLIKFFFLDSLEKFIFDFLITFVFRCRGKKYIELPYTVKGMDVSFSGILTFVEVNKLKNRLHSCLPVK